MSQIQSALYPNDPRFLVYSDGRVKHIDSDTMLNPSMSNGYYECRKKINGVLFRARLNIMVAETFLPNSEGKREVRFINGNRLDCRLENLAWQSNSERNKRLHKEKNPDSYNGVFKIAKNKYQVVVFKKDEGMHIGEQIDMYKDPVKAAIDRDIAIILIKNGYAELNFPDYKYKMDDFNRIKSKLVVLSKYVSIPEAGHRHLDSN